MAYEIRISDWSSDVCSSDLPAPAAGCPFPRRSLRLRRRDDRIGDVRTEAALVVLGHGRALDLVALVEEGHPEGEGDRVEDPRVLRPGDHRAGPTHGRDGAAHEPGPTQLGGNGKGVL